jgi:cellulose biosynthesis protein BcsQ
MGGHVGIGELVEVLKEFSKEYGSLIKMTFGVVAIPFGGYTLFRRKVWKKIQDFWRTDIRELKKRSAELEGRLDRVRDAFNANNDLWLRQPVGKPLDYDANIQSSIPILLIANLKGGVGKTTIAANLAAYFETNRNERVLAIDIDHQGSLSSMLLPEHMARQERSAEAIRALIEGANSSDFAIRRSIAVRNSTRDSRVIDCDDPFANFETQLVLKWLIGDIDNDIRYNLARVLHSAAIQRDFSRVIIDAPPRLTTGFVNALCASTHLVVPFVLDILSSERVGLFLGLVQRMQGELFPRLKLAGVIGTMKGDNTAHLRDAEKAAIAEAERQVSRYGWHSSCVLRNALIPRKQAIADAAGERIAYHRSPEVRTIFDPLGAALFEKTKRSQMSPQSHLRPPVSADRARRGGDHESWLAHNPIA